MAFEQKNNTFSLFENDKKGNDRRPDYSGKGLIDGEEMKIAIWKKVSKSGIPYLSGTVEKTEKTEPEPEVAKETTDEIPF